MPHYFQKFNDTYPHLAPEQYGDLAARNGLRICIHREAKVWNSESRSAFFAFGLVTFVEWSRFLPVDERPVFIIDVLDATDLSRPINLARRIPLSVIGWMSRFVAEGKTAVRSRCS